MAYVIILASVWHNYAIWHLIVVGIEIIMPYFMPYGIFGSWHPRNRPEVGRSCIIIKFQNKKIMLDCGIHPAFNGITSLPFFDEIEP